MKPPLKKNPTLKDLQEHIRMLKEMRGWNRNYLPEVFLLFIEEVGELANAIRNSVGLHPQKACSSDQCFKALEEEFADVLNFILDLANHCDVDLEKAYRDKALINEKRTWVKDS